MVQCSRFKTKNCSRIYVQGLSRLFRLFRWFRLFGLFGAEVFNEAGDDHCCFVGLWVYLSRTN